MGTGFIDGRLPPAAPADGRNNPTFRSGRYEKRKGGRIRRPAGGGAETDSLLLDERVANRREIGPLGAAPKGAVEARESPAGQSSNSTTQFMTSAMSAVSDVPSFLKRSTHSTAGKSEGSV